jgi:7-cyano-7-deazaguanine synthase
MQKKAFVLLSGGLDSTTCLYKAIHDFCPPDMAHGYGDPGLLTDWLRSSGESFTPGIGWVEAISIDYGQRHIKEAFYAAETCKRLGIEHHVLSLEGLLTDKNTMLATETRGEIEIPNIDYADIKGVSPTYVPNRNMTMLAVLTAHAQKYVNEQIKQRVAEGHMILGSGALSTREGMATFEAKDLCGVYFGAHAEDAHNWAYPDCTPEFIGAMANAIYMASYSTIRLHAPLMNLDKKGIVRLGTELGVPFGSTWSCYKGEQVHCGTCPTCRSRRQAFEAVGITDPTVYADTAGNH